MFPAMRPVTKERLYGDAKSMGVHPRQFYSVLDLREVAVKNSKGVMEETQLIRLMDPWAGSVEWQGACSDFDEDFWTKEAK